MSPFTRDLLAAWFMATALVGGMIFVIEISDRLPSRSIPPGVVGLVRPSPLAVRQSAVRSEMGLPNGDTAEVEPAPSIAEPVPAPIRLEATVPELPGNPKRSRRNGICFLGHQFPLGFV